MIYYHIFITLFLYGLCFIVVWNLIIFRRHQMDFPVSEDVPFVSVLVPARNEEHNIRHCVESLLTQDYPAFEVIVLDDGSTDNTCSILRELEMSHPQLRVLTGGELPAGWVGKNYACQQLADAATGSWLLFTDADTLHERHSISASLATAEHRKADLLTLIPRQVMVTFSEKLILPLLHFISMTLLPFYFVEFTRLPHFAIGIGQFMLFRREVYTAIGGHEAVGNALVEDVWLARRVKEFGYRLVVASGVDKVQCRMYRGFDEIWRGFSKNIFAGFNFSFATMTVVMIMLFLLFVVPFGMLSTALFNASIMSDTLVLPATQVLCIYGIRLMLSLKFRLGVVSAVFHPVGILFVLAISWNSYRWIATGQGAQWKGRAYQLSLLQQDISTQIKS